MPVRGGFRGGFRSGFRGRGGPIRGRGVPPQRNYSGNTFNETSFEQVNITTNSSRSLSDMDFTTDDFPVQMTWPNTYEPWGNTTDRKRTKSMDYDAPSKKHRSHGPTPPPFALLPPRPFPPRLMGPFGLPPRHPGPPMPDMGPPFARRFMGPGPGFSGPPPPHLGPRGPARFPPPPFSRPGPPMRPVGFRPPVPPRGFPNGVRAPPGGLPRRGTFGGPPRMFKQ